MPTPKTNVEILKIQIQQRKANIVDLQRQITFEKDSLRRLEKLLQIRLDERAAKEEPKYWVSTEHLSRIIIDWMRKDPVVNTMKVLSFKTDINERQLRNIKTPITQKTSERVADKIMTAIGLSHLLGDELEIFQLPSKPFSHYEEE